jgi:hypothetical protein
LDSEYLRSDLRNPPLEVTAELTRSQVSTLLFGVCEKPQEHRLKFPAWLMFRATDPGEFALLAARGTSLRCVR